MRYVGIQTQIQRNNMLSMLLLLLFPTILLGLVWVFLKLTGYADSFLTVMPCVIGVVGVWFAIAYYMNASMVRRATGARPLERRENPRIYNIVENLCMSCGMDMPQVNVVDDPQLNAFASGIDAKSYTVTVTTGLADRLTDEELAGVIGHELTHIRNRDTRLLITSIVFVGIVSALMTIAVRGMFNMMWSGGSSRRSGNQGGGVSFAVMVVIGLACSAIAYFFALLTRFAISRRREFMADAGGAELCQNPWALASALRKISNDPGLGQVEREDIAQLYIIHPKKLAQGLSGFMSGLFSTHPSTAERIRLLEQY